MKAIWMKQGIMTLMTAAVTMGAQQTANETMQWEYEASQDFTAVSDGVYQFELYGAQGGSYQNHTGGKGGMVNMQVSLHRDDQIELVVGQSDGGGHGTLTTGGGATSVRINGVTVAVAGGGGGATDTQDGGYGGETLGGGSSTDSGESSTEPNSAGGGGGYQGGQSGYTRYHEHTGSEENGGGCYTGEIRHTHDGSCFVQCGTYENFRLSDDQPGYVEANCSVCGEWGSNEGDMDSDFITDGSWTHTKRDCGKDNGSIEKYRLSCGKTESTIEENRQAYGGTNYYDTAICKNVSVAAGVRQGNGKIAITQLTKEQRTLNYYDYDMTLLGSVTIAKGDTATYPIKTEPFRREDSKYSYTFSGWDDMETGRKENLTGAATVQSPVTENRNYIAVYRNVPREYTVALEDAYGHTVEKIVVTYGKPMPEITLPVREDSLFGGYYLEKDGKGTCYYSAAGASGRKSDIVQDETLYASWVKPVAITGQPVSVKVESDYTDAYMEVAYENSRQQDYTVAFQWYMQHDGKQSKVEKSDTASYRIPAGYQAGEYDFWCELTVSSLQNGQQIRLNSDKATFHVNKAVTPPKKDDPKPPASDKDNTATKPGGSDDGTTTKPGSSDTGNTGNSNNETTNNPNGSTSNQGGTTTGASNDSSSASNSTGTIPTQPDTLFTLVGNLPHAEAPSTDLPAGTSQGQSPQALTLKTDKNPAHTSLTIIPDENPWKIHAGEDDTSREHVSGIADEHKPDRLISEADIGQQFQNAYEAELVRANYSFLVGLSILGLIGIFLLILFLSNSREDRCAAEEGCRNSS